MKHMPKKFMGQCIAIVDRKVVASGKTQLEVYVKAKETHPSELISLMYVPRKREIVTFL